MQFHVVVRKHLNFCCKIHDTGMVRHNSLMKTRILTLYLCKNVRGKPTTPQSVIHVCHVTADCFRQTV